MDLRQLYQEVIVDHNRNPRNQGKIADPTTCANGYNRLCGDKLTVYLTIEEDIILDAKFDGCGCAISTASASLMTEYLKGKTTEDVESMFETFHRALTKNDTEAESRLGKLSVLSGVKSFPARVKCATLAWHTLHSALQYSEEVATTE